MHLILTPGFESHPAVVAAGNNGTGLYVRLATWALRYRVKTWIVPAELARDYGTPASVRRMVAAGLATAVDSGYQLRNDLIKARRDDWRAHIPAALRDQVMARDGHRCVECGSTYDLTLDHILPWSLGGPDTEENLRVLCRSCNSRKGDRV